MKKLVLILSIIFMTTSYCVAQCNHCSTPCANSDKAQCDKSQKINWMSFQEAIKLNETAPKKIFIDIYAEWCGWCVKMNQTTFLDKDVVEYMNENYYAVKFDSEQSDTIVFAGYTFVNQGGMNGRKGTHQLAAALLQGRLSYPSYVFVSENNLPIVFAPDYFEAKGYMEAKDLLNILKYIKTDSFMQMTFEDFIKSNQ